VATRRRAQAGDADAFLPSSRPCRTSARAETRLQLLSSPATWQQNSFASSALERMQVSMRLHRRHHQARLDSPAAFTLHNYGNISAPLWPSPSPSPSPSPTASESSEMRPRQLPGAISTGYSGLWSHMPSSFSYACAGVQENTDGTCTPPLSTSTGETITAAGVESSSSTPTASSASATFGSMDDEIDLLLRQIQCFVENGQIGDEAVDGIDGCFRAMDHEALDGGVGSWSSCSTPGVDSVFHDYVQGYNQC
jgi:myb proto-oncogene protein